MFTQRISARVFSTRSCAFTGFSAHAMPKRLPAPWCAVAKQLTAHALLPAQEAREGEGGGRKKHLAQRGCLLTLAPKKQKYVVAQRPSAMIFAFWARTRKPEMSPDKLC